MQYVRVVRSEGRPIKVDPDVGEAFELYGPCEGKLTMKDMLGSEEKIINYVFNFNYLFNPLIKLINIFRKKKLLTQNMYIRYEEIVYTTGIDYDLYVKFKKIRDEIARFTKDKQEEMKNN